MSKIHKSSVIAAISGHIIERYDIALYGYFSVLLTPIFFSADSRSIFISLAVFAAGYFMRPLGGLFFGYIGDKYGRKQAFSLSVMIMIFPTLVIGILPSYQIIGIWASIILLSCRLIQGLCGGGEFGGAGIFVNEHLPKHQIGFSGGLIASTGLLGGALGNFCGVLATTWLPAWGWRLPFIFGAFLTLYSYIVRRQILETPIFKEVLDKKILYKDSFISLIKSNIRNMLCLMVIGGCGHMQLYITLIYMNVVYVQKCHFNPTTAMWINTTVLCIWIILAPLMGWVADKIGVKKVMTTSAILMIIFSYPLFKFFVSNGYEFKSVIITQICLSIIAVGFTSCISSLFTLFFPVTERYRCAAFSVTLGQAIMGSTAPLLAIYLVSKLGNACVPAIQLIVGSVMGVIAVIFIKKYVE